MRTINYIGLVPLSFLTGFVYYFYGLAIYDKRFVWKRFLLSATISTLVTCLSNLLWPPNSPVRMTVQLLVYPVLAYCVFDQRGIRVVLGAAVHLALILLGELAYGALATRIWSPEVAYLANTMDSPYLLPLNLLSCATGFVTSLTVWWLCRTFRSTVSLERPWVYIVRPIALSLASLALLVFAIARVSDMKSGESVPEMLATYATVIAMLLLSAVYVHQDTQLLKIARSNESLVRQQKIYDTLLTDTRAFRHNIANLLYGFEGAMLTGDMGRVREYYEQMARKCARINNENIVALNRIPSPPVCALLLNKLSRAADMGVPTYLLAEENLLWRGLPEEDLCQALGALIDNALEAAADSRAPYVAVEFDSFEGAMEIAVRNTFDAEKTDLGFLEGQTQSAKPGHEGIGLVTVRDILARHDRAALNQMRRGRYVESLLLIE